jgi:hypothetical protein
MRLLRKSVHPAIAANSTIPTKIGSFTLASTDRDPAGASYRLGHDIEKEPFLDDLSLLAKGRNIGERERSPRMSAPSVADFHIAISPSQ